MLFAEEEGTVGGRTGVTFAGLTSVVFLAFSLLLDFLTGDCSVLADLALSIEGTGGGTTGVSFAALVLSTRAFFDFFAGVAAVSSLLGVPFSTSPCLRFLAACLGVSLFDTGGAWVISTSSLSDPLSAAALVTPNG